MKRIIHAKLYEETIDICNIFLENIDNKLESYKNIIVGAKKLINHHKRLMKAEQSEEINNKLQDIIKSIYNEMIKVKIINNSFNTLHDNLNKTYLENTKELLNVNSEYEEISIYDVEDVETCIQNNIRIISNNENNIKNLQFKLENIKRHMNEILVLENKIKTNEAYKLVVSNEGILSNLLSHYVQLIETSINSTLSIISPDKQHIFKMPLQKGNNMIYNDQSLSNASGFRKTSISLALSLAIWQLSDSPVLNGFFLDETLSTCDKTNLGSTLDLLRGLIVIPNAPKIIFLITHSDKVKADIEKNVYIEGGKNESKHINYK